MNSIVCTLFEGQYHYGGAGLINSLYANGFTGSIFIGYKGELPSWASEAKLNNTIQWGGCKTLMVTADLQLHFVLVNTTRHMANYKALFMLELTKYTEGGIFYIDPDIVVKCNWTFFERWITYGVAIVQEITANHMSPNHPKRARWKPVIESCGKKVERELYHYFNSGFCGVNRENIEYLETWEKVIAVSIQEYGMDEHYFSKKIDQLDIFPVADQDALNIAAMCSVSPISDFGPEGMDFIYGGWLMSHATGKPKPWASRFIWQALRGKKISQAEKNYWIYADGLIKSMPASLIKRKRLAIKIGSLINRFYSRS